MEIEKGRILVKGETYRKLQNSKEGRIIGFIMAMIAIIISLIFLIYLLLNYTFDTMIIIDIFILFFIILISIGGAWAYRPRTWNWLNIVYKNGISGIQAPFLHFSDIDKIIYGKMNNGSRYLQIFSKKRSWKLCPDIIEDEFINDYYNQVIKILKQKCPNIPWIEMKWLEWKN